MNKFYALIGFCLGLLMVLVSCEKYGSFTPIYSPVNSSMDSVKITGVSPLIGKAGVGQITIQGSGFSSDPEKMGVYLESKDTSFAADIASNSESEIVFYRPNVVNDSLSITVVNKDLFKTDTYSPYKLAEILKEYTDLTFDSYNFESITMDAQENLYVFNTLYTIYKVDADGKVEEFATPIDNHAYDIIPGPDNYLYYTDGTQLNRINLETGADEHYVKLSKTVRRLAFATYMGKYILYGARRDGMFAVLDDKSNKIVEYEKEEDFEVFGIQFYNQKLYVMALYSGDTDTIPEMAIWENDILDETGTLSEKQLVCDLTAGEYGGNDFTYFNIDENGIFYVCTPGREDYGLFKISAGGTLAPIYKDKSILPLIVDNFVWGDSTYIYTNSGATIDIDPNDSNPPKRIKRVDMGIKGAGYVGR